MVVLGVWPIAQLQTASSRMLQTSDAMVMRCVCPTAPQIPNKAVQLDYAHCRCLQYNVSAVKQPQRPPYLHCLSKAADRDTAAQQATKGDVAACRCEAGTALHYGERLARGGKGHV